MAGMDRTGFLPYLRERWAKTDDAALALLNECPLLGLLPKPHKGGKYVHVPILQTGAQGRSATYATAVANATKSVAKAFDVTYVSNYGIVKVEGDIIDDSAGNENALYDALDHEMKAGLANLAKDMRLNIYNNHGGARGKVGAYTATELTFTLANPEDAVHLEVGMMLEADTTDGTSGTKHAGDEAITAINRQTGVVTAAQAWDTGITGFAADDYIFEAGDFGAKMSGLLSWIPASAPGATAFFGVDRSADTERLGGVRYDGTGETLENAMLNGAAWVQLLGGKITHFFCNPIKWAQVVQSLGADRLNRLVTVKGSTPNGAEIGYDAVMVVTEHGLRPLVSDPGCHKKYIMGLNLETLELPYSAESGDWLHIIETDGQKIRRGSADDWQADLKVRCNLTCNNPGSNLRITVES
jgi:hypothetical protein